ncbi:MAG: hypothetical protein HZA62_14260 [Rhodocyclales bacterium]|nr:hypothetical protein [Rhodocyclales bacterium]
MSENAEHGIVGDMNPISSNFDRITESLPFVIRCVRDEAELAKAVAIRRSAYGRHVPELAARFTTPEPSDLDGSSRVLVALAKLDGMPLGSMRYRTNQYQPLDLEQSVSLPAALRNRVLTEATRLAVSQAAVGRVVKAMLMKAMFLQCEAGGIDCIVAAARHPMDRFYQWLYFEDVFPGGDFIPMAHAGMIPHRVMCCDVVATKRRWQAVDHPWYSLFFETRHPDIELTPFPVAPTRDDAESAGSRVSARIGHRDLR